VSHTVTLDKGITVGDTVYKTAVLREPNAMDLFESMKDAEVVMSVPVTDGQGSRMDAQLIASPTRVALNMMLRQIVSIGEFTAPIPFEILEKLSTEDFNILQRECERLELASSAVTQRGRSDGESAAAAETD
jgi:phage FluMu protein gp41